MTDLWYSEYHAKDVRFGIQVDKVLHSEQTPFQRIDFFHSETFGTFFTLDGLMMVTEKDEFCYHDMIVHPAFAVNPGIKRVLIIGGGDGGTAREVCRYRSVERVDMVEIDRRVVELCMEHLPQTASVLRSDPRVNLYYEDGVKFVANAADKSYDLILVDSTDPIGPGEGLFSTEFYENCKRALVGDGILVNQHESPYYPEYAAQMTRAHRKLAGVFPLAQVYQFHMPTYPSGHWLFGFASKGLHPVQDLNARSWEGLGLDARYYNTELHRAAFSLPTYVRKLLSGEEAPGNPNE